MVKVVAAFSSALLVASAICSTAFAGTAPVAQNQNFGPPHTPEKLQVTIKYDPATNLYCVAKKYKDGIPVPAPACRTAKDWNHSGLLARPIG